MREGYEYSKELVFRIRKAIEKELTVRHVPDIIIETPEIPYNLNEKKMEITVKKLINGLPYNQETIINRKVCISINMYLYYTDESNCLKKKLLP
ncbi:uncharacterized protein CEXT_727841 [Caerostris extrusa]|uniref:Uncharacterized protein n=1 Tax=Caerostris extrusa TaxID=172846 RepID=A0AAV4NCJ1_CAEEX|nr:uncharacterized protein CEXT_727841 [Caerostris extrusa]